MVRTVEPRDEQRAADPAPGAPPRPGPAVPAVERLTAWLRWFGVGRLVLTALSVAIVAAGGFWLVRAPAPPAEADLPVTAGPATTTPPPTSGSSAAPTTTGAPPAPTMPATIVVHVAGRVREPGVLQLPGDSRVHDAVEQAGGAAADANLDALNLAQPLADGQRLYVPRAGEVDPSAIPTLSPPASAGDEAAGDGGDAPTGPVDINRATSDDFERLPGVGPATAQAIIDDRARNGPFLSVDDLERVPGIGPAKLAALRDLVSV